MDSEAVLAEMSEKAREEEELDINQKYGLLVQMDTKPESDSWEVLERFIASGMLNEKAVGTPIEVAKAVVLSASKSEPDVPMDSRTLAMYQLSEYLCLVEGDIWQVMSIPAAIGLTEIIPKHEDEGVQRVYRELFELLEMDEFLRELWMTHNAYGNAYPLEFWDGNVPVGLSSLNPKHVVVEPIIDAGRRPLYFAPPGNNREALKKNQLFMRTVADGFNEQGASSKGYKLKARDCYHIHGDKFAHQLYAIPPLVRAQRSISTRMMLEEMVRATIEGVKNQIILWTLENPGPKELGLLNRKLKENRAARVGHLAWRKGLEANQIIPGSVDELLGNDTWIRLTLDIMRKLGFALRIISGEVASVGQANDFEVDVQLFIDRLRVPRGRMLRWLRRYCNRFAEAQGIKEPPTLMMKDITLEVQQAIKNRLVPMMNYGLPSVETALELAGLDPKTEIPKLEKEADGIRKKIRPYSGFAQDVVNPDGSTKKTTESPQSPGRPSGGGKSKAK